MNGLLELSAQEEHPVINFLDSNFSLVKFSERQHEFIPTRYHELMISQGKLDQIVEFGENRLYNVFRGLDLSRYNFANLDLEYVIFEDCEMIGANFENANLTTVRFVACRVANANFDNAKLKDVKLWKSNFKDATFNGSTLLNLYGFLVDFTNVDFTIAVVQNAYIWIGNFKGAKADPDSGFRTRRGGDTNYVKPFVCGPEYCTPECRQPCTHNKNPNVLKMPYEM